jgi:hypothetical protein
MINNKELTNKKIIDTPIINQYTVTDKIYSNNKQRQIIN